MYNNRDLMDKVVLNMNEDHVTIDASDIVLKPFQGNYNESHIRRGSIVSNIIEEKESEI
jgi:hypothetical protein